MHKKIKFVFIKSLLLVVFITVQALSGHHIYAAPATCIDSTQSAADCTAGTGATSCARDKKSFLGIPTWYEYLSDVCGTTSTGCTANTEAANTCHSESGFDLAVIWLVALAVVDILLRLGGFISFGIVMYGGFKYVTSQGQPDGTKAARQTILNAFIGIAIIIVASISVRFVASVLQK